MINAHITHLAELALQHSLFEPLEPSLKVATTDNPNQVVIPLVYVEQLAKLVAAECARLCEQNGEDVDNGDVFRTDPHRQTAYETRWSTGSFECADLIRKQFGVTTHEEI